VRCELTPETAKADFEVIDFVEKPGGTVSTAASFRIENGRPGLVPA
jgi:alkaline phosphatase D